MTIANVKSSLSKNKFHSKTRVITSDRSRYAHENNAMNQSEQDNKTHDRCLAREKVRYVMPPSSLILLLIG